MKTLCRSCWLHEEAVISGQFLQETYYFEPSLVDKPPLFTPEEEEFARTGMFTLHYPVTLKYLCVHASSKFCREGN